MTVEIVLLLMSTNWLSTVRNKKLLSSIFPEKSKFLKTLFWTISPTAIGEISHIVFVSMGNISQQNFDFFPIFKKNRLYLLVG
jgi:hypothetical protein